MESKWPFMLITISLLFGLGVIIAKMERTVVMNNWDKRRCDFSIMAAATFFKPDFDPRSKNDFANDNFSFCMKTYVVKFIELFMKPINAVFEKQIGVAGNSADMVNTMRSITKSVHDAFTSLLGKYVYKFNSTIFEMSRIMQYLGMAMKKLNAIMVSLIYVGLSVFRSIVNAIQFIIKVILIICGIILGLMIILIFVLFPFIPLIVATLGAVVAIITIISVAVVGAIAGSSAADLATQICFAKDTKIVCEDGIKCVSEIKLGDKLKGCGEITATIKLSGKGVKLFDICGIHVSGSHLVKGEVWNTVAQDPRSIQTDIESDILYCFNTSSNNIPVQGKEIVIFRDWEEINDIESQRIWSYMILKKLNNLCHYSKWKDGIKPSEIPIMNAKVKTVRGFVNISELDLSDKVLDRNDKEQAIIGIIKGKISDVKKETELHTEWHTELYELHDVWIKGKSTLVPGSETIEGRTLITETGEFIIWDGAEKLIRDFTDIGHDAIHETYPFICSRLNRV